MKKSVRHLKVGDVLSGSGAVIVSAPFAGVNTPKGKVEVGVTYPGSEATLRVWNPNT